MLIHNKAYFIWVNKYGNSYKASTESKIFVNLNVKDKPINL